MAEFREAIKPQDHRVFFGVLDLGRLGLLHRLLASLPASRASWAVDGDFRDWRNVRAWATGIAHELAERATGRGGP